MEKEAVAAKVKALVMETLNMTATNLTLNTSFTKDPGAGFLDLFEKLSLKQKRNLI
jgi:hypothetical protein